MNIAKWLPKQNNDMNKIFTQVKMLERELRILGKKFATNINYKNPDLYVSSAECVAVDALTTNHLRCLGISGFAGSGQHDARRELTDSIQTLPYGPLVGGQKRGTVEFQGLAEQKSSADTEEFKAPSLPVDIDRDQAHQTYAVQWRFWSWLPYVFTIE